ncbi:hypothetical protein Tco_0657425 [Tanacetum coccineum]|uniref:Uncharacterized protein n=1 Tax=Tanacetum coccineum TaxID=301880 RepID=A0ABQ4XCV2_9ASTR
MEENKSINRSDIQKNLYNALVESYNFDKDIISLYGKEAESSKEPTHKESKSTSSSKGAFRSQLKSLGKSAHADEHGQKVDDLEDQPHQDSLTPDREWHKTKTVDNRPPQPWITQLAQAAGTRSLFNEFLATPIDFSAFIMNRLKIDNLTQEVLTGSLEDVPSQLSTAVQSTSYYNLAQYDGVQSGPSIE